MVDTLLIASLVAGVVAAWFRATDETAAGGVRLFVPFKGFDALTGVIGGLLMWLLVSSFGPEVWLMAALAGLGGYVANDVLCSVAKLVWQYRRRSA